MKASNGIVPHFTDDELRNFLKKKAWAGSQWLKTEMQREALERGFITAAGNGYYPLTKEGEDFINGDN